MLDINNINTTNITGTTTWTSMLNLGVRIINAGTTSTGTTSSLNQINVASTHTFFLPASPYEGMIMIVAGGSLTSALNILTVNGNGKGTEWLILSLI